MGQHSDHLQSLIVNGHGVDLIVDEVYFIYFKYLVATNYNKSITMSDNQLTSLMAAYATSAVDKSFAYADMAARQHHRVGSFTNLHNLTASSHRPLQHDDNEGYTQCVYTFIFSK